MFKNIQTIYVVYISAIVVIVGGGLVNLQRESNYWPHNNGELKFIDITKYLLFLIIASLVITSIYAIVAYIWKKYKKQKFSYKILYEVFVIILILVSIPVLWIIPSTI